MNGRQKDLIGLARKQLMDLDILNSDITGRVRELKSVTEEILKIEQEEG